MKDKYTIVSTAQVQQVLTILERALDIKEKLLNMIEKNQNKVMKYQAALEQIAYSDQCERCDGCGYDTGCGDRDCAIYIANEVLEE